MRLPRNPVTFHCSSSREWLSRRPRWLRTTDLSQIPRRVLCWALYLEINKRESSSVGDCGNKHIPIQSDLISINSGYIIWWNISCLIFGRNWVNLEITQSHTFFSWKNCGYWTKWPFSFIVIDTNFDFIWWKGQDAFIPKDVSWCVRRGDHSLYPCCGAKGAESNNIAKSFSIL